MQAGTCSSIRMAPNIINGACRLVGALNGRQDVYKTHEQTHTHDCMHVKSQNGSEMNTVSQESYFMLYSCS